MQERLKNALTAIGFCMLALVMTSVFATTVKAETNAELKNRVYEEVLNNHITNESDVIKVAIEQYQGKTDERPAPLMQSRMIICQSHR